jgi:hypothetical protein
MPQPARDREVLMSGRSRTSMDVARPLHILCGTLGRKRTLRKPRHDGRGFLRRVT